MRLAIDGRTPAPGETCLRGGLQRLCCGRENSLPTHRQRVDERAHIAQENRRTAGDDELWLTP